VNTGHQFAGDVTPFPPGIIAIAAPWWYAIQTRFRHEKLVACQLKLQGINTFLPLVSEVRRWSDRRKLVQLPLFSGYVFVRIVALVEARLQILRINGVVSMVGARGQGTPIPDRQIENIQKLLTNNTPFMDHPFLRIVQRVRIRGGCLDGVEGILLGCNGNRRLVVSVESIERSLALRIEGYEVESIS
jgi:transcription antitermination factor NusG